MGDWSDNLEYEQREYYGHFYDPDREEETEEEETDDLISRQAVLDGIEELKKSPWATDTRGTGFEYLIAESLDTVRDLVVKQMPSVENKGEWIWNKPTNPISYCKCSVCNSGCWEMEFNFCPNCGADMRGE